MSAAFDLTSSFAKDLPAPSSRFSSFPKYNFVGGHNVLEGIPTDYPHGDQGDPRFTFKVRLPEGWKRNTFHDNAMALYGFE